MFENAIPKSYIHICKFVNVAITCLGSPKYEMNLKILISQI